MKIVKSSLIVISVISITSCSLFSEESDADLKGTWVEPDVSLEEYKVWDTVDLGGKMIPIYTECDDTERKHAVEFKEKNEIVLIRGYFCWYEEFSQWRASGITRHQVNWENLNDELIRLYTTTFMDTFEDEYFYYKQHSDTLKWSQVDVFEKEGEDLIGEWVLSAGTKKITFTNDSTGTQSFKEGTNAFKWRRTGNEIEFLSGGVEGIRAKFYPKEKKLALFGRGSLSLLRQE